MSPDPRAVKILFDTYWSSKGWKSGSSTPPADLAYAKSHGVMFDRISITRAETLDRLAKSLNAVSKEGLADAFVVGISQHRPELRSALGSYAICRWIPDHDCAQHPGPNAACTICGQWDPGPTSKEDLNVLNFERFKWGGVRHGQPLFGALDLELFAKADRPKATEQDRQVLRELLEVADAMPEKAKPSDLVKATASVLRESGQTRATTLTILGFCGVFLPKGEWSYWKAPAGTIPYKNSDWGYPMGWWRGSDRVNWDAARDWFPWLKTD